MGPLGLLKVQPQQGDRGARAPIATLIAVKLWIPDSDDRQVSRLALRGFTDNQSNEALVKKAMTFASAT